MSIQASVSSQSEMSLTLLAEAGSFNRRVWTVGPFPMPMDHPVLSKDPNVMHAYIKHPCSHTAYAHLFKYISAY